MAKKSTTKEGATTTGEGAAKRRVSLRVPESKPATRKPAAKSKGNGSEPRPVAIPQEIIALRAYFISEQRIAAGLPGDSFGDWLEAERQIRSELK